MNSRQGGLRPHMPFEWSTLRLLLHTIIDDAPTSRSPTSDLLGMVEGDTAAYF